MMLMMQVKKDGGRDRSYYDDPVGEAPQAADAVDGSAEIAVARCVLIAVTA